MKNKITTLLFLSVFFLGVLSLSSCKKDKIAEGTDKELYDMAIETEGFTWYKNSDALLNKSAGSGHSEPYLKTRYNAMAASQLDANGKVKADAVFAEGAFIVKELLENETNIGKYAILFKDSGSPDADANGWVWGYLNADGTVVASASDKGSSCIGCHSQADNIDYMLMNKYFP